jgi:hypothetical protein
MFRAHVEAMMLDEDTAEFLSTDEGWLAAARAEATDNARNAGKTVNGQPTLVTYTLLNVSQDGSLYDFQFDVPVA